MSVIDQIKAVAKNGRIPYTYKVGEKSKGMPFDVKLSVDADFKKAITKWVSIASAGIAGGIIAGFFLTRKKK